MIRRSTRPSLIRLATDFLSSAWGIEAKLARLAVLGDVYPSDRLGLVRSLAQFLRQFVQPLFFAVRLDHREGYPVDAFHATVDTAAMVGVGQDVLAINLVVEGVEPVARRSLRFGV